jgi:phosphopantothenate---cysteine ligase (CTP)
MKILVTAGNTLVRIDQVRCLTNIFTGRTGTGIALHAHVRSHDVTLLTSNPEIASEPHGSPPRDERWHVCPYRTFEELRELMRACVQGQPFDAVIHSAAVSDYLAGGAYTPAPGTRFDLASDRWLGTIGLPAMNDRQAGKIKSDEPELWLRLVRAPKLIDLVRTDWQFCGVLVKFKLEVGRSDDELLQVAERSRKQSAANLMVANTLEGAATYAFLGPVDGAYQYVARPDLAARLLENVERLHAEQQHG